MKFFKKNQLAILVISLMLITAGYLNYDTTYTEEASVEVTEEELELAKVGDAELVSSEVTESEEANDEEVTEETEDISTEETSDDYFTTSKLERSVMYSQMIERYQSIIESSNALQEQKTVAQEEIDNINEIQNSIMIAENLLTTKGFTNNIIFVNGDSINVIIEKDELLDDEVAQIQNIIARELEAEVENIHISLK